MVFVEQMFSDSPAFIARVESFLALAVQTRPANLILIRIDNWFGERWVGFGGKFSGLAGIRFMHNLVLPPFVPSRVVQQVCYCFSASDQQYVREQCAAPIHIEQASSENLRRFVDVLLPTTALVWFSDKSAEIDRGSVMAYVPSPVGHVASYAEFVADRAWAPTRLIGLARDELKDGFGIAARVTATATPLWLRHTGPAVRLRQQR
jgi:hypothetical protein